MVCLPCKAWEARLTVRSRGPSGSGCLGRSSLLSLRPFRPSWAWLLHAYSKANRWIILRINSCATNGILESQLWGNSGKLITTELDEDPITCTCKTQVPYVKIIYFHVFFSQFVLKHNISRINNKLNFLYALYTKQTINLKACSLSSCSIIFGKNK